MLGLRGAWQNVQTLIRFSGGYFLTTFVNQALPFLILPILTRFWSPEEYGTFVLFNLCLMLVNTLAGTSIPAVISKHFFDTDRQHVAELIGNSVVISGLLSLAAMVLILVVYPFTEDLIDVPLFWMLMIPIGSFAFVVFNIGLNVMKNERKVFVFSKHQVGNTVINMGLSLALVALLLWGWQGRATGILVSYVLSALFAIYYLHRQKYLSFHVTKERMNEVWRVVLPLIPNSLQSVIISQVGIFFIEFYYTTELLGIYAIGYQIAFVVKLVVLTLSLSWSPYLYEQISAAGTVGRVQLTRYFLGLWALLAVGLVFVNAVSGFILRLMATPDYYAAEEFIFPLTLGFLFYGMYVFLMPILIRNEQQNYVSIVSFINAVLMIALNFGLIKVFGYMGVAYAFCVTYFIMFAMLFVRAEKIMPLPWGKALAFWKKG